MAVVDVGAGSAVLRNNVSEVGAPDGPVVLLAHGFGSDQSAWADVVPALAEHHRVVLLDHVGAGGSDLSAYEPGRYSTLEGYTEDLLEVCEALDLQDVTLVAHSVGSMMAVRAAIAQPERFARLVLVSPSPSHVDDAGTGYLGGFTTEDVDGLLESLDSNYFGWAQVMAPVVMGTPDEPDLGEELAASFCRTDPDVAHDFARVTFLSDSRHLLGAVPTPALVLQCQDDALAPPEVGEYLHQHLRGSTLVHLHATGHCPHVSAPEETADAVLAYLARAS